MREEDYLKHVLEKWKKLQEQLQLETEKRNKSPENATISNEAGKEKNHKIHQSDKPVKRSNRISEGVIIPGILSYVIRKTVITPEINQASPPTQNPQTKKH